MDERTQAIIDCARIAWKRMGDCWAARDLMEGAANQCAEALLIFERIRELAPDVDWEELGMMFSDDPRRKITESTK
jgi:hypothetical protein